MDAVAEYEKMAARMNELADAKEAEIAGMPEDRYEIAEARRIVHDFRLKAVSCKAAAIDAKLAMDLNAATLASGVMPDGFENALAKAREALGYPRED